MNIAIMGAGCVGSVFAELLYKLDPNKVKLLATGKYAERLNKNGLCINGVTYKIPLLINENGAPDLVVVCVKNYDLDTALNDMAQFIDEHTIILPMLNSVSPTPTIKEYFPQNRVLYGYITKIDACSNDKEFSYHIAGDIHFGYADNEVVKPELLEIQRVLNDCGFNVFIDKDMVRGVWKKWMLNVGANQVSALTESNYLHFAKIPEIDKVLRLAMQELLMIACYEGVNLSTQDISDTVEYLTTYPYPKETSMLQDVLARRKTEVDYISGDIIRLSNKWNCPCPVNLTMYYLIKSKEKTYLMQEENDG